jgi:multiple sugar transport system permease protein
MIHIDKKTKNGMIKALMIAVLLMGAFYAAFPVLWMFCCSLKPNAEIFATNPTLISPNSSFDAYLKVLLSGERLRFFANSYLVASVVTVSTLVISMMAAYAFSRYDFKLKKVINVMIICTQSVPGITLLIPYYGMVIALGLFNTYWALIITYAVFTLPYAIIMMTGYFNTLPRELDEAIMIDGAGPMYALWRVLVPISVPGIVSVGIYTFMTAWNEYLFANVLTRTNDMRTVPVGISLLMGQHNYAWNEMMSLSIVGCIPILIMVLFFQKYFISGMTAGSIKS